jgi:sterol desaturase/sphingolipid hydroxylase (fatty acid hydroxylase superfamily)
MLFAVKLTGYFLLWSLWSYGVHVLAHSKLRRFNLPKYVHRKHHGYRYEKRVFPPWHDYFFWFGDWRSSLDVYITFTIPLIALAFYEPVYGGILLGFHYIYEVFLSRDVLDHNPNLKGSFTRYIPVGVYHMAHHRDLRCNFSFYLTVWDFLFRTDRESVLQRQRRRRSVTGGGIVPVESNDPTETLE